MLRPKYNKFWAGGFLYDAGAQSVFLHKRDGNTKICPHQWAFFGGLNEGAESFVDCFVRELDEEIGLRIQASDAKHLREYMHEEADQYRVVFYVETAVREDQLVLGEGAGFSWIKISDVNQLDFADKTHDDLKYFFARRQTIPNRGQ